MNRRSNQSGAAAGVHSRDAVRPLPHGPFDRGKGGPGGWIILDEPELHLHGDVLVPDLAGWRRTRMPELPDASSFELAPDSFDAFELELAGLWAK